jgi:sulfur carrier protein ThiS
MNLYILGEENPSHEILTVISWYLGKNIEVDIKNVKYEFCPINGNLFFEITGISIENYEKIYYAMVSSAGNSFVDYMIFEGDNPPDPDSKPVAAVEATKNDPRQSGNMSDQRAPKMIALKEKYGRDFRCAYLINNPKTIERNMGVCNHTHDCAFAAMNAIGVEIIFAQTNKVGFKLYQVPFKYDTVNDLISMENEKKRGRGTAPRVIGRGNGVYDIQVNLFKSYGNHDPGEGYLASRAYILRNMEPNSTINVINHGRDRRYFERKDNKLINCLKYVGVTATVDDGVVVVEKNQSIYQKSYWEYTKSGEKNASIVLEQFFIALGKKILFTNHAGCGRSFINLNGEFFQTNKSKGIPDIVAFDEEQNTLLVIEGETSRNYKKGIAQVLDPAFDEFINREFVSRLGEVQVKKYLCTFGAYNNEPEVIFNLTSDYQINYNEGATAVK